MGWWTDWKRRRILARHAIDEALWARTVLALPCIGELAREDAADLRALALLFLAEKRLVGAQGFALDDAMRVTIAAQACLPILRLGLDWYEDWVEVIVYPGDFRVQRSQLDETGVVHEWEDELAGEAMPGGPVVLSWDAATNDPAINVVIHEFAHKLDMRSGDADGMPPLHPGMSRAAWHAAFSTAYEGFRDRVERRIETWLDPYAAEDPAEFFAVVSEAFFVWPRETARRYPEVYAQLAAFYRQDPVARLPAF